MDFGCQKVAPKRKRRKVFCAVVCEGKGTARILAEAGGPFRTINRRVEGLWVLQTCTGCWGWCMRAPERFASRSRLTIE